MTQLLVPHESPGRTRLRPAIVTDIVSPAPRDIWHGLLRDDPGATPLQTPEYVDAVLAATGGTDVSRFYQLRDGRQLVLPLVRRRAPLGLSVHEGYPGGFGHGGLLATGGLLAEDVRTVVPDLRGQSLSVRIGGAHHTSEQWSAGAGPGVVEETRRVEIVDLSPYLGSDPAVFRQHQFSPYLRQQLIRSKRLGVEVEVDSTGRLIPTFYDIYRAWRERSTQTSRRPAALARRTALREEPYQTFATVAARMGDACRVSVAWHRGSPVAASIVLVHGAHAIGWHSYSIRELAAPVSASMLAQVAGVENALASGCRSLDLGQAGEGSNLLRLRNHLGASLRSVVDLRIEGPGLTRLRGVQHQAEGLLARAARRSSITRSAGDPGA